MPAEPRIAANARVEEVGHYARRYEVGLRCRRSRASGDRALDGRDDLADGGRHLEAIVAAGQLGGARREGRGGDTDDLEALAALRLGPAHQSEGLLMALV